MGYRDYSTAKGHIVDASGHGDFLTVQAGINAAVSGQTVFVRNGTYTEDVIHKAGVNVVSFTGDAASTNVNIIGKWTISGPGTFAISQLSLTTNSDYCINMVGSDATVLHVEECLINATNNTAINYSTSNASSVLVIYDGVVGVATDQAFYTMSSPGNLTLYENQLVGYTTITSTNSAGSVSFFTCQMGYPLATSGTGNLAFSNCRQDTTIQNLTCITTAGTGIAIFFNGELLSGTASSVVIGAGTAAIITHTNLGSSNTNVLTGGGTLKYAFLSFSGSSSGHNVTTETALPTL